MKLKQLSVIEPSMSFVSIKKRVDVISGGCGFDKTGRWFWFDMINTDFGRELFMPVLRKGTNWNVVDDVIGLVRDCLGGFEYETFDRIQVPIVDVLHYVKYNITTKVIYSDEYL